MKPDGNRPSIFQQSLLDVDLRKRKFKFDERKTWDQLTRTATAHGMFFFCRITLIIIEYLDKGVENKQKNIALTKEVEVT